MVRMSGWDRLFGGEPLSRQKGPCDEMTRGIVDSSYRPATIPMRMRSTTEALVIITLVTGRVNRLLKPGSHIRRGCKVAVRSPEWEF